MKRFFLGAVLFVLLCVVAFSVWIIGTMAFIDPEILKAYIRMISEKYGIITLLLLGLPGVTLFAFTIYFLIRGLCENQGPDASYDLNDRPGSEFIFSNFLSQPSTSDPDKIDVRIHDGTPPERIRSANFP